MLTLGEIRRRVNSDWVRELPPEPNGYRGFSVLPDDPGLPHITFIAPGEGEALNHLAHALEAADPEWFARLVRAETDALAASPGWPQVLQAAAATVQALTAT